MVIIQYETEKARSKKARGRERKREGEGEGTVKKGRSTKEGGGIHRERN